MAKRATKPAKERASRGSRKAAGDGLPARRPAGRLEDVLGQSRAIGIVRRAIAADRVHHAWLFHGPGGVGKFTSAMAMAGELLTPPDGAGEDAAQARALARSGEHPDLHVITKELASVSRSDRVRAGKQRVIANEVVEEFMVEPALRSARLWTGSRASKVFIVDEAEVMSPEAQNMLLKTLEEPPAGTVFILVSRGEDRLFPTIRSRCQRVAFLPLARGDLDAWIAANHPEVEGRTRQWLGDACEGSPGEFESLLESGALAWRDALAPMLESSAGGRFVPEFGATMAKLVDEHAKKAVEAREGASKDAANRAAVGQMFRVLAGEVRRSLRRAAAEAGGSGGRSELSWALRAIESLRACERRVDSNVNLALSLEGLAMDLSRA